jgi:hypothetical protein
MLRQAKGTRTVSLVIFGRKSDPELSRAVSRVEGEALALQLSARFIEMSAKMNATIEAAFLAVLRAFHRES